MVAAQPAPEPARISRSRTMAADPSSVALLLAGPAAVELWPGVRRVAGIDGRITMVAELAPPAQAALTAPLTLRARPPRRTPTAYLLRFEVSGRGLPELLGNLTLHFAAAGAHNVTRATLDVDYALPAEELLGALSVRRLLERSATGFLDRLAAAAESRALAA
ncbi:MAG: hypothetical protein M3Z02_07380 [Actinomycetota bacterium]|nr:hypothetical protein [Actinomycetota bacterium]